MEDQAVEVSTGATPKARLPRMERTRMKCSVGHENVDGQNFCGVCGLPLATPEPSSKVAAKHQTEVSSAPTPSPTDETAAELGSPDRSSGNVALFEGRTKWAAVGGGAIVALALLYVIVGGGGGSTTLTGSVAISASQDVSRAWVREVGRATNFDKVLKALESEDTQGIDCSQGLGGGISELHKGSTVVVRDGDGTTVGTGYLEGGNAKGLLPVVCTFTFSVELPRRDFYQFTIGSRSGPTYSRDRLDADGWQIELSIG